MAASKMVWRRTGTLVLLGALVVAGWSYAQARKSAIAPESLIPQQSLLFIRYDGTRAHAGAMERTAAHDALYKSDLLPTIVRAVKGMSAQAPPEAQQSISDATQVLLNTIDQGIDLGITIDTESGGPPAPWGVAVLRGAGRLEPRIAKAVRGAMEGGELKSAKIKGRNVTSGMIEGTPAEFGWWVEGEHIVVAVGFNAINNSIAVADKEAPNVTAHPLFGQATKSADFEVVTTAWFDLGGLREMFGAVPLPLRGASEPKTVQDVAEIFGLGKVGKILYQGGVKDRSLWTEVLIEAPGERTGLLSLANSGALKLEDLPPLPVDCSGFAAGANQWAETYDHLVSTVKGFEALVPEEERWGTDHVIGVVEDQLGFKIRDDLASSLGPVSCVYYDGQLPILMDGVVAVLSVKDAATLQRTLDAALAVVQRAAGPQVAIRQIKKAGQILTTVEIPEAGVLTPTFCVTDKWLCLAMTPQPVEAFLLRLQGKLPHWSPSDEQKEALAALPRDVTSISMRDPRSSIRFAVGVAPMLTGLAKAGIAQARRFGTDVPELPISVADLPPAEVVSNPLFPNFSVTVSNEKGIRFVNRSSLPGLIEGGPAVAAVGVALILPAVQQARSAARRTQSMNNMKMLGLSLHNFHDTFNHFPAGTRPVDDAKLKPDQRSSWLLSILPYEEQAALYNQLADNKGEWDAEAYREKVSVRISSYQNPSIPVGPEVAFGPTHYVGVAGLTEKGPTSKADDHEIAGIFAYERETKIHQITDGMSNTAMVVEVNKEIGPWAQGGRSTIRPFVKKPYFKGPDGIGGPLPKVNGVLMGDGSVRMVSDDIDASVVEAIATMSGGEVVGDF